MKINLISRLFGKASSAALTFLLLCYSTLTCTASQLQTDYVTLTVLSTCASAQVQLTQAGTLSTPFSKTYSRGQVVTLSVDDLSVPSCESLQVVTRFRGLVVNNRPLPKGQPSVELTLERDTSVLIQYGKDTRDPFTLSVWSSCTNSNGGIDVRFTENFAGKQEAVFKTHFDATLLQGQSVQLEAPHLLGMCGNLGVVFTFLRWSAGGKAYPDDQRTVDITIDRDTVAVAHYGYLIPPPIRVDSFHLFRKGEPVTFIKAGERLGNYTIVLEGESFPPDSFVVVDGVKAELIKGDSNRLEAIFPGGRIKKSKILFVGVRTPDEKYSNPAVIEIRKD